MQRGEECMDATIEGGYAERACAVCEQEGVDERAVLAVLAGISFGGKGEGNATYNVDDRSKARFLELDCRV